MSSSTGSASCNFCSTTQQEDPITRTPASSGPNANFLADSLGVSPLYRQQDSQRWQNAAQVYQSSSRARSPTFGNSGPPHFTFEDVINNPFVPVPSLRQGSRSFGIGSPISLEDIANINRNVGLQKDQLSLMDLAPSLELEAIAAVHELSCSVKTISVSEILPRTADLIFVNIKTFEDQSYTLELTMKGWRVASTHTDSMNGDYKNVELHARYFKNAKEVLDLVSPDHARHFNTRLAERLKQLEKKEKPDDPGTWAPVL